MENPSITVTVTVTVTYTVTLPNQIKIFVHLAMHECVFFAVNLKAMFG